MLFVRCNFRGVKTGAASCIRPSLRKVREERGTRFYGFVSGIEKAGPPAQRQINDR